MKKNYNFWVSFFILNFVLCASTIYSQDNKSFGISLNGFVKSDIFYDSREVVSVREGHFLLFPANEKIDINGNIINNRSSFNILSIQTRLTGKITAPDILGAKTTGLIEGAFFGNVDNDINGFRLRHAIVKLDWGNNSLLVGQYWNPMFNAEIFPDVVSFNTGAPFQPFARNPQIRFQQRFWTLNLTATAYSQRDFSSPGPSGNSSIYLRNSSIPAMNFQLSHQAENFIFGLGSDYKQIKPRLVTEKNFYTNETLSSISTFAYSKLSLNSLTLKLYGIYGQNLNDLTMLGGYGVKEINNATGIEKYTNLNVFSIWGEIIYGKDLQYGIFLGYTKNEGSHNSVVKNYARGYDIDYVYRISPRIIKNIEKFRIASELELTTAAYGKTNSKGKVQESKEITNLRFLLGVYLFF